MNRQRIVKEKKNEETEVKQGEQDMKRERMNIFKNLLLASLFMATLISSTGAANADMSIVYDTGTSGSVAISSATMSNFTGSNIALADVYGLATPQNAGVGSALPITNGVLNFSSGALTQTGTNQFGQYWYGNSGGQITLQGGIPGIVGVANGSTLLTGSFLNATVQALGSGSYQFTIAGAQLAATDNQSVYNYYGIPMGDVSSNDMNLTFTASTNNTGGFTSLNIINGSVIDTPMMAQSTSTPIPAAVWLLGSGLMGLVGIRSRIGR
ncbi:MAG: VPLPA-CTERM sorting domain-containing protein [Thermodesulfovibrionales bacterium]|jgi:hypothetical protein